MNCESALFVTRQSYVNIQTLATCKSNLFKSMKNNCLKSLKRGNLFS